MPYKSELHRPKKQKKMNSKSQNNKKGVGVLVLALGVLALFANPAFAQNKKTHDRKLTWAGTTHITAAGGGHFYMELNAALSNPHPNPIKPALKDEVSARIFTPFPLVRQSLANEFLGGIQADLTGAMVPPSKLGKDLNDLSIYAVFSINDDNVKLNLYADSGLTDLVGEFEGPKLKGKGRGDKVSECILVWTYGEFPERKNLSNGKTQTLGSDAPMPYGGELEVEVIGGIGNLGVTSGSYIAGLHTTLQWLNSPAGKWTGIYWDSTSPDIANNCNSRFLNCYCVWEGGGVLSLIGAMADPTTSTPGVRHTWYFTLQGGALEEGVAFYELFTDEAATKCVGVFGGDFLGIGGGFVGTPGVRGYKANFLWEGVFK